LVDTNCIDPDVSVLATLFQLIEGIKEIGVNIKTVRIDKYGLQIRTLVLLFFVGLGWTPRVGERDIGRKVVDLDFLEDELQDPE
jgi:hypothetical protein